MTNSQEVYSTKSGVSVSPVSPELLGAFRERLWTDGGLSISRMAEAASYSLAMVVRYALGLSAQDGQTCVIAGDSLSGLIALGTLRHLASAGARGIVMLALPHEAKPSPELSQELNALSLWDIPSDSIFALDQKEFAELSGSCHNVILGVTDLGARPPQSLDSVITTLNEARVPVHTIECPLGVDPSTGSPCGLPLYASSTLSLGAPLTGLLAGSDFVGRHYVCDTSLPELFFREHGIPWTAIFAEQPVVQLVRNDTEAAT